MPFCDGSGARIWYEEAGAGPPMLLIHPNGFDHTAWMYQAAFFSARFRMIAPDLRGYGRSEKVRRRCSMDELVGDVVGVCRHAGVERAVIGGVSVGSGIAMALALAYPEKALALVLVGGASSRPKTYDGRIRGYAGPDYADYLETHVKACMSTGFPDTPIGRHLVSHFLERGRWHDGETIAEVFRARGDVDLTPRLGEIGAPTLVINGEHDMSLAAGSATATAIRGARRRLIAGAGHVCQLEDPSGFNGAVLEFLADNRLLDPSRKAEGRRGVGAGEGAWA